MLLCNSEITINYLFLIMVIIKFCPLFLADEKRWTEL